ncbi:unnamed protein product, partial [Darwinula stevensoni]
NTDPFLQAIVWDEELMGPFGLVCEASVLKEHEVRKMIVLSPGRLLPDNVKSIIFITRPSVKVMDVIAESIRLEERNRSPAKEFHLLLVPRKSFLCTSRLIEHGAHDVFHSIEELSIDLYLLDSFIVSMEWKHAFKECHLENDTTCLFHAARALMTLQSLYGTFPRVIGKGQCSKQVWDLMSHMQRDHRDHSSSSSLSALTPRIHTLILIDRAVDLLTPLATQLTYEGFIDEILHIERNVVKIPAEKIQRADGKGPQEVTEGYKHYVLTSQEELYAEIRDKHFNALGPIMVQKTKFLKEFNEENKSNFSIAELIKEVAHSDEFRDSLKTEQEFLNGMNTDQVHPYIVKCLVKKEPMFKVGSYFESRLNGGLKQKVLEYYQRSLIHTYGFHHIHTLYHLENAGLLKLQGRPTYTFLRRTLRLSDEDVSERNPTDIAYVHSGYAPLSVRVIQRLSKGDWASIEDALLALPGPLIDERQQIPLSVRKKSVMHGGGGNGEMVTLVFFLGGCTFAEIAALRFLSQQADMGTEFLIGTTGIINGTTFLESIQEVLLPS